MERLRRDANPAGDVVLFQFIEGLKEDGQIKSCRAGVPPHEGR